MNLLATHPDATLAVIVIADVVLLSWLFVRVGKDQIADEDLATPQLRRRSLSYYAHHLNEERANRLGLTRSESRIAPTSATTNSNAPSKV